MVPSAKRSPAVNVRPVRVTGRKPDISIFTEYVVGTRFVKMNTPFSVVVRVRSAPVASLVTVTLLPATIAPDESTTVPVIDPVTV
jgi:hypothetical protein